MAAPGLSVVTAPRLGPLFDRLADAMARDPLPPLERETIVVTRNTGLRAWLTHALARRLGCAAALDLPSPVALVARLADVTGDAQPFEAEALAWRLAPLLADLPASGPEADTVAPLRAYLDKTGGRAMPLAVRLGELFDDYQVYRPDVLAAWERGETAVPGFPHEAWQAALWRTLRADGLPDRPSQWARLERRLARDSPGMTLPQRVSVFGGLVLPPVYLRLLAVLARHVPVTLYAVTPGPEATTTPHAHPLLRALAGRTREFWQVMADLDAPTPIRLGATADRLAAGTTDDGPRTTDRVGDAASGTEGPPTADGRPLLESASGHGAAQANADLLPPAGEGREGGDESTTPQDPEAAPLTLPSDQTGNPVGYAGDGTLSGVPRLGAGLRGGTALAQLQAALADDLAPSVPGTLDAADRSIRVHDAHSPRRELEALRDALLDAFADIPDLRPSDVLVLLPDLDTYAPLVDAVFGAESATGGAEGLRLPVHVVHHPHAPALRVVEAFRKALRMHDGRVTASELLDLLAYPVVRQAAGIAEDELPRLRSWVAESGVCWGLTGERKAQFGLPADDLHTWRFGLDRLLLGVMTGPADRLVLGHAPCDAASGDGGDLLGRFCEWAEALFSALAALDRPARLGDWPGHLLRFLDGVFAPEADEEVEAVVFLRTRIAELEQLDGLADGPEAEVAFRTVRSHLDGATSAMEVREPMLTGRVTFANPLVLRHAPHRVVAFLGLGDGTFPGPEASRGYSLLDHAPRPGDRADRALDKQLFLDAVMAAGDRLILSTVGRSQKDNAERAASVCLDAFLDACDVHWGPEARDQIVARHRLQPFAGDYFKRGGPLRSYAGQHRVARVAAAPSAPFLDREPLPEADPEVEIA
ncbi:MAG: exodeoxyribonuclease V subunit gamma, partial [Bacteroidota bacterium]